MRHARKIARIALQVLVFVLIALFLVLPGTIPTLLVIALFIEIIAIALEVVGLRRASACIRLYRARALTALSAHKRNNIKSFGATVIGIYWCLKARLMRHP